MRTKFAMFVFVLLTTHRLSAATADQIKQQTFSLIAADSQQGPFETTTLPRNASVASDCGLNDLTAIGHNIWAVGDRSLLLKSIDGGHSWSHHFLPFEATIRNVQFLTEQVGYLAGSRFDERNAASLGFIAMTEDGGVSWKLVAGENQQTVNISGSLKLLRFPEIVEAKFFGTESAIVLCRLPSGLSVVLKTDDECVSWKIVESHQRQRFRTADFGSTKQAILGGHNFSVGALVGDKLVRLSQSPRTQHQLRSASYHLSGLCFLVGDAGMVLRSTDGGISFDPADLGAETERFEFDCVDHINTKVAVGGFPGSTIFLSENGGRTWTPVPTGCSLPLRRLRWISESTAFAIGDLGVIHRSNDGGRTWQNLRGSNNRLGILQIVSDANQTSTRLAATVAAEHRFRMAVWQPSVNVQKPENSSDFSRLSQAGISSFRRNSWFSRRVTGIDQNSEQLLQDWSQQTDGKATTLLPEQMATVIRTWKPDVICLQASDQQSEMLKLLRQASSAAIVAAADETYHPMKSLNLSPWQVKHVLSSTLPGQANHIQISGNDLLSRLGTQVDLLATGKGGRINFSASDHFVFVDGQPRNQSELFRSLALRQTGSNQRAAVVQDDRDEAELRKIQQQAKLQLVSNQQLIQSERPLAAIARLQSQLDSLPTPLAIRQLRELADSYRLTDNIDGEIAILKQLVQRFPDQPQVAAAAERLFLLYSSTEFRSQRKNVSSATAAYMSLKQKNSIFNAGGFILNPEQHVNQQVVARQEAEESWDQNATIALDFLKSTAPLRYQSAEVQLRIAANRLRNQDYSQHQRALAEAKSSHSVFAFLAQAEMQSVHVAAAETPVTVLQASRASKKPFLDGVLDDTCWEHANETRLQNVSTTNARTTAPLLMMSWDQEFLYLAGIVTKPTGQPIVDQSTKARKHDFDHATHDRLNFFFDIDRDYQTGFRFTIDETGQTSEACCGMTKYNPTWHVAHATEGSTWRFEAAIPVEAISNHSLNAGSLWAIRVDRIMPGHVHDRILVKANDDNPQGFGLLRLIERRTK